MAKDSSGKSSDGLEGKVLIKQSSNSSHRTELKLKRDPSGMNLASLSLSDFILSAGVSTHGSDGFEGVNEKEDSGKRRASFDSAAMVEKLSHIPINLRGRAEKWEIPRSEVQLIKKIGEGEGGIVFKCRWRSLDCAAKLLNQESKTSIAYYDMINEISVIRSPLLPSNGPSTTERPPTHDRARARPRPQPPAPPQPGPLPWRLHRGQRAPGHRERVHGRRLARGPLPGKPPRGPLPAHFPRPPLRARSFQNGPRFIVRLKAVSDVPAGPQPPRPKAAPARRRARAGRDRRAASGATRP